MVLSRPSVYPSVFSVLSAPVKSAAVTFGRQCNRDGFLSALPSHDMHSSYASHWRISRRVVSPPFDSVDAWPWSVEGSHECPLRGCRRRHVVPEAYDARHCPVRSGPRDLAGRGTKPGSCSESIADAIRTTRIRAVFDFRRDVVEHPWIYMTTAEAVGCRGSWLYMLGKGGRGSHRSPHMLPMVGELLTFGLRRASTRTIKTRTLPCGVDGNLSRLPSNKYRFGCIHPVDVPRLNMAQDCWNH